MSSGDTIKTTVRLPADLHWQFQSERAKRRLSNEKAISDALACWIAHPRQSTLRPHGNLRLRRSHSLTATPDEREFVEILLHILRDNDNPARASTLKTVLQALFSRPLEERAKQARPGVSTPGRGDFEKRVEQPRKA
jgi:hypothetical protein